MAPRKSPCMTYRGITVPSILGRPQGTTVSFLPGDPSTTYQSVEESAVAVHGAKCSPSGKREEGVNITRIFQNTLYISSDGQELVSGIPRFRNIDEFDDGYNRIGLRTLLMFLSGAKSRRDAVSYTVISLRRGCCHIRQTLIVIHDNDQTPNEAASNTMHVRLYVGKTKYANADWFAKILDSDKVPMDRNRIWQTTMVAVAIVPSRPDP
ncbi:hypothetical protein BU15DRAFT_66302 [Melanogaster broomeanus]|nr:hypothetical protein BU15DRAFT_66302 [Melanogaster broomeanus]